MGIPGLTSGQKVLRFLRALDDLSASQAGLPAALSLLPESIAPAVASLVAERAKVAVAVRKEEAARLQYAGADPRLKGLIKALYPDVDKVERKVADGR